LGNILRHCVARNGDGHMWWTLQGYGHYRGTDTTFGNKCYYIFFLVEASNHSYMSLVYDNCKQTWCAFVGEKQMIDREITVGVRTLQSFPEILGCVFEQSERELIYVTYDKNSHNFFRRNKANFLSQICWVFTFFNGFNEFEIIAINIRKEKIRNNGEFGNRMLIHVFRKDGLFVVQIKVQQKVRSSTMFRVDLISK